MILASSILAFFHQLAFLNNYATLKKWQEFIFKSPFDCAYFLFLLSLKKEAIMSLIKKICLLLILIHTLIGALCVINISAIYNDEHIDKQQCMILFNSQHLELCYNLIWQKLNYCPIKITDD